MAAARGEFLRFIDADDVLEPRSTARLLELAGSGGEAVAYGSILICDDQLRPLGSFSRWWPGLPLIEYLRGRFDPIDFTPTGMTSSRARGFAVRECLLGRLRGEVESIVFPRRVVDAVGDWYGLPISMDWDFLLRVLEHAPVRGERAVATYYRRHGGQSTRQGSLGLDSADVVLDRYFERHPEQRDSRLERRARARIELRRAGAYAFARHAPFAVAGRQREFAKHLRRSAELDVLTTCGRLLAWSPWLLAGLVHKHLRRGRSV